MADAYAHCEALVRGGDKDRFLSALFAPAESRRHLFALYAFNLELARVREAVRQPMLGEIRLQWWRDALSGAESAQARANPVAAALLDTIAQRALPTAPLLDLIEARSFDLYDDPMPTLEALRGYLRMTSANLIAAAAAALAGSDPALGEAAAAAGGAAGLTAVLAAFPQHARRGQLYVPTEVLVRNHTSAEEVAQGRPSAGIRAALSELRGYVRDFLDEFRRRLRAIPEAALPAFLLVALVPPMLARMEAQAADPFAPVSLPQWRRQWILWRAARRGLA